MSSVHRNLVYLERKARAVLLESSILPMLGQGFQVEYHSYTTRLACKLHRCSIDAAERVIVGRSSSYTHATGRASVYSIIPATGSQRARGRCRAREMGKVPPRWISAPRSMWWLSTVLPELWLWSANRPRVSARSGDRCDSYVGWGHTFWIHGHLTDQTICSILLHRNPA